MLELLLLLFHDALTGSRLGENPANGSSLFIEMFEDELELELEEDVDWFNKSSSSLFEVSKETLERSGGDALVCCSSLSDESESEDEIASIL